MRLACAHRLDSFPVVLALGILSLAPIAAAQTQPTSYTASWASVDQHPPAPEWFKDAKFGIYFHWGAFGTAAFGSEWYPRNMFNKGGNSAEYQHQLSVYGDPLGNWGFDKFILGANDKMGRFVQFAPKLVTNGGAWDPDAMAQLLVDAGAWFAGPVAEHHDGFSMRRIRLLPYPFGWWQELQSSDVPSRSSWSYTLYAVHPCSISSVRTLALSHPPAV